MIIILLQFLIIHIQIWCWIYYYKIICSVLYVKGDILKIMRIVSLNVLERIVFQMEDILYHRVYGEVHANSENDMNVVRSVLCVVNNHVLIQYNKKLRAILRKKLFKYIYCCIVLCFFVYQNM